MGQDLPRTDWSRVVLLYAAGLLAAMQFAKVSLVLDDLAAIYPGAPVTFLVSAVAVVGVLAGIVAGQVVARVGARRAILWAVAGSALASILQATLPPFAVLMLLRLAEGAGHLALVVALPTLMAASASDSDRPVVMALWGTFFGVGFALAALLLRVLPDASAVLLMHGVTLAVLWPVLWRLLPATPGAAGLRTGFVASHLAIWSRARLMAPGVGHGLYTSLFIALVTFLPGALDALWLAPLLPLTNLAGTVGAGFAAKRIAASALVTAGFAAAAAGFALLWVTGSAWVALTTMGATGVIAGAGFAAVPWLNRDRADQARANGGMAQLGNVGTFTGTPLLGAALAGGGVGTMLGLAVAICVIGTVASAAAYGAARRAPTHVAPDG